MGAQHGTADWMHEATCLMCLQGCLKSSASSACVCWAEVALTWSSLCFRVWQISSRHKLTIAAKHEQSGTVFR